MKENEPKGPPPIALAFLEWFCPASLHESVAGDLQEQFEFDLARRQRRYAVIRLWWNILRFFRPSILLRHRFSFHIIQTAMLLNYFKLMVRNLLKRKGHALVMITGLAIGLAFSMLTGAFIWKARQVNATLADNDRLYIVEQKRKDITPFMTPAPAVRAAKDLYPHIVEDYYRFWDRMVTISKGEKHFRIQGVVGDSTFLTMFGFPILHGDARTALSEPASVVITKKIARQYFNREDVVGETLTIATTANGDQEYKITAVLDDLADNSVSNILDINAQIFFSTKSSIDFGMADPEQWNGISMIGYVKLTKTASAAEAAKTIQKIINDNIPEDLRKTNQVELLSLRDYNLVSNHYALQNLLIVLGCITFFILFMAAINFVNISIGTAAARLKEIGVRKTIGGLRKQVAVQFLMESITISCLASAIAVVSYVGIAPAVSSALKTNLPSLTSFNISFWIWWICGTVLLGIAAGSYPSFYLSSMRAVDSLKGKLRTIRGKVSFSSLLVSVQFVMAITIFMLSIVITRQVSFFLEKDLGYDKKAVLTISSVPRIWNKEGVGKMETAKQEFLTCSQVKDVSLSWEIPNQNFANEPRVYREGYNQADAVQMPLLITDEHYASTYSIPVLEGVYFGDKDVRRSRQLVINAAAQKALGNVGVGDHLKLVNDTTTYSIAGVIRDFHFFSLREQLRPMIIIHTDDAQAFRYFSLKLTGNLADGVKAVEQKWKVLFPNDPFEYAFMDENLQRLYQLETKLQNASRAATVLMLLIVLLGVMGLASIQISKRTKEIGVRKVLGATYGQILMLLSRGYVRIILVSFVIAVPLAYYLVREWLQGFAYRIDIEGWMFVLPLLIVFIATLLVVGSQSLQAAFRNPRETLRYE